MRVGLYRRAPGHEQEDNLSMPEQVDRIKKYCESRDAIAVKKYKEYVLNWLHREIRKNKEEA